MDPLGTGGTLAYFRLFYTCISVLYLMSRVGPPLVPTAGFRSKQGFFTFVGSLPR
jgi:hypothetical protein